MYRVHPKHHQHLFSPLNMLYNYVNQTKQSFNTFMNQYLKLEARSTLLKFNRYMVIIVILNIDIKFLLFIVALIFIIVKMLKLKPWVKNKHFNQLPFSYNLELSHIKKYSKPSLNVRRYKSQQKSKRNLNDSTLGFKQKESIRKNLSKTTNNQHTDKNLEMNHQDLRQTIITNIQAQKLQQQIYRWINKMVKMYCKFLWFVKPKTIALMWLICLVIYFFQPNLQNDAFHIVASTDDGVLQIQSIKKASQYVNYFQLIFLWIVINLILFYINGTKQLKTELLQQLYTKQYTYNLIKQKKTKTNRLYSKIEEIQFKSFRTNNQEHSSQRKTNAFLLKKKSHIGFEHLRDLSFSKVKSPFDDSEIINLRKLSHIDEFDPSSPLSHKQTKKSRSKLHIEFVQSQEQSSEQNKSEKINKTKINLLKKQQNKEDSSGNNTIPTSQLEKPEVIEKKKVLQRKNNFLPQQYQVLNINKNLQKNKIQEQQNDIKKQKVDFKIELFKVEKNSKQKVFKQN